MSALIDILTGDLVKWLAGALVALFTAVVVLAAFAAWCILHRRRK